MQHPMMAAGVIKSTPGAVAWLTIRSERVVVDEPAYLPKAAIAARPLPGKNISGRSRSWENNG